jgi:hypothetical protein
MANVDIRLGYKDSAWFTANATLVLKVGQMVYLQQTGTYKIGDGTTQLSALSFLGSGSFVPYTGATSDVNLGEFGIQLGNLEFDNTPTNIPTTAGSVVWNDTDGTLDLKLKGGNVTLQIGQEQVSRVVNKTATNITLLESNYQAVRVTGAQGQRLKVDLALATNDLLSAETIGLVTETIANNQEGFITTSGLVRNINTTGSLQSETWADGDIVYLSPTTAGNITNIKPIAPNHIVIIGYVVYAHITQGTIFVKVDNGYELDELHNVLINSVANNDVLTYDSATSLWKNKQSNSWVDITASCTIIGWLSYSINKIKSVDMGSYYIVNGQVIGISNSSNTQVVLPFTNNGVQLDDCRFAINNGTNIFARCFVLAGSNIVDFRATVAGAVFASLGTKAVYFTVIIEK